MWSYEEAVSTLPYKTTPRKGGMRGPVWCWAAVRQTSSHTTCLIQLVLFPGTTQKMVELTHLIQVRKKGLHEQSTGVSLN